jgi:L-rhamnonate dehydratase
MSNLSRRAFLASTITTELLRPAGRHKIAAVDAFHTPLAPTSRFGTSTFQDDFDRARWRWFGPFSQISGSVVIRIRTNTGITGYGLGGGGGAAVYIIEHHLRDLLLGVDPLNIEMLWDQMHGSTAFYGRRGLGTMAISGIDLALWDIAGKAAGLPVYKLAGGATKPKVPVYFTSNNVKLGLELGCKGFKLAIDVAAPGREGMKGIVDRVAEVRAQIGPDADLMFDCLARFDVPYTLELAERLAPYHVRWIEEPIDPDDTAGYEALCAQVRGTLIASGEHEYTRFGFADLIRHKAVQVLQPDISWSGGFTELRRIAALADRAGLPLVPHRGGSRFGIHFIMATPSCQLAESFGIGEHGNELMQALTPRFEKGFAYAPEDPGFGVELNEAILKKVAVPV